MTNLEILEYLTVHNIFLFDPLEFEAGKFKMIEFYTKEIKTMVNTIDQAVLDKLECDDYLRELIKEELLLIKTGRQHVHDLDLEGEQQDVPKPGMDHLELDPDSDAEGSSKLLPKKDWTPKQEKEAMRLINRTYELLRTKLLPILAIVSRSYKITDFIQILRNRETGRLIKSLVENHINLDGNNYIFFVEVMDKILNDSNNIEIVNAIREIYATASPSQLRDLIAGHFIPTEKEKKSHAEIPTPIKLVNEMLDHMPVEFWTHPRKVFEPCCGKGNFVIGIFDRFYRGLEKEIPDQIERCHIIMNYCLYYADINPLNGFITTEIMKCHVRYHSGVDEIDYPFNSYVGDTLELNIKKHWGLRGFDAVIGNPPYNLEQGNTSASPLYHLFIEKYIDQCVYMLFVVPSRWFSGGKGLDEFRKNMLKRSDIRFIRHYEDASQLFGRSVEIKGGVNYFLKDSQYDGPCDFNGNLIELSRHDVLINDKYVSIIEKFEGIPKLTRLYCSQGCYSINSNDERLVDEKTSSSLKCYVSKQKGFIKYIDKKHIKTSYDNYKVITTEASHKASSGFGNMFIGRPNEVHTQSYISFNVKSQMEAESLYSYLQTKFSNLLLSLRKKSQHISKATIEWIPLPPLDRIWTDTAVYQYYQLSPQEIEIIRQTTIVGYVDKIQQQSKKK